MGTQLRCPKCGNKDNYRLLRDAYVVYKIFVDEKNVETYEKDETIEYDAVKVECFECGYHTEANY